MADTLNQMELSNQAFIPSQSTSSHQNYHCLAGIQGKIAIVTGSSRGIGRAIALALGKSGAKLVLTYSKNDKDMDETKSIMASYGIEYLVFKGSVENRLFSKQVVSDVKAKWGGVDILVNNAGIIKDRPLMLMSEQDWDQVIDVNLKGAFNFSKEVLSSMMSRNAGRIINISSLTAIAGREAQTNYGAAKAGLIGFTKSLAREAGYKNILVNAIVAGLIDTQMIKKVPRELVKKLEEFIPLRRIGKPEEVANVVLFLASDLSSYMTGAVLNISGGEYM